MSLYTVYPPQKEAPTSVHARAYETRSNFQVTHCCTPTLSPELAIIQQLSAVRASTGPTNSVDHPSISGRAVLLKRCPPKNRPKFTPAHDLVTTAVSHKHHSIIRVGAGLIQFAHACTCNSITGLISIKTPFRNFFGASFFWSTLAGPRAEADQGVPGETPGLQVDWEDPPEGAPSLSEPLVSVEPLLPARVVQDRRRRGHRATPSLRHTCLSEVLETPSVLAASARRMPNLLRKVSRSISTG